MVKIWNRKRNPRGHVFVWNWNWNSNLWIHSARGANGSRPLKLDPAGSSYPSSLSICEPGALQLLYGKNMKKTTGWNQNTNFSAFDAAAWTPLIVPWTWGLGSWTKVTQACVFFKRGLVILIYLKWFKRDSVGWQLFLIPKLTEKLSRFFELP